MAQFFGQRSRYLINKMDYYGCLAALIGFVGLGAFLIWDIVYWKNLLDLAALIVLLSICPLLVASCLLYKKIDDKAENFWQGLRGEDNIAKLLKTLPDVYSIYADVKIKPEFGNIDYVVVGPTGLFTIEVKSHRGIISFNGVELVRQGRKLEKDFLKQSMSEAMSMHDYLSERLATEIFVKPVIVFSNFAKMNFGLNPVRNVFVVQKRWLKKFIESQMVSNYLVDRQLIEKELLTLVNYTKRNNNKKLSKFI